MFRVGDYAVCPGHGVGRITGIEERDIGEEKKTFYAVKIVEKGMTIMIPTDGQNGLRALATQDQVSEMFEMLSQHDITIDTSTWNRRHREYTHKINTGSLVEIAEVLRALFLLKARKPLSFGEKKMLEHCLDLLSQEISLADGSETSHVASKIESCFTG